jgi:hypothetical protein
VEMFYRLWECISVVVEIWNSSPLLCVLFVVCGTLDLGVTTLTGSGPLTVTPRHYCVTETAVDRSGRPDFKKSNLSFCVLSLNRAVGPLGTSAVPFC